jgi:hypothetical protein
MRVDAVAILESKGGPGLLPADNGIPKQEFKLRYCLDLKNFPILRRGHRL